MEKFWYDRIKQNDKIKESDKEGIYRLFDVSAQISFGKIGPRQEGYILNDNKLPRCTSIMQMDGTRAAALMEWAKREICSKMQELLFDVISNNERLTEGDVVALTEKALLEPDRQRDDAGTTGTAAHDNIECWLKGEKHEVNERLLEFQYIWKKEGVELVCTELPLAYCKDGLGFGGRLDILAYKDGKFIIYDNKTSKSVHQGYALQVSAYKAAVEQMSDGLIKIDTAKIIHLPDLNTLKKWQLDAYNKLGNLIECKDLDKAFEHYKILLSQYAVRNNKYF